MRAVIDANVLISGLFWHGAPHTLLTHAHDGVLDLVSSPALLAELEDVIGRAKFDLIMTHSNTSREQVLASLRLLAELVVPPPLVKPVCRDPDDDAILALAAAAHVDLIVSGDDDLLTLGSYAGIPIVTPDQAIHRIAAGR